MFDLGPTLSFGLHMTNPAVTLPDAGLGNMVGSFTEPQVGGRELWLR